MSSFNEIMHQVEMRPREIGAIPFPLQSQERELFILVTNVDFNQSFVNLGAHDEREHELSGN